MGADTGALCHTIKYGGIAFGVSSKMAEREWTDSFEKKYLYALL